MRLYMFQDVLSQQFKIICRLSLYNLEADAVRDSRCLHCRNLEPTWKQVAERLKGHVHVAKVAPVAFNPCLYGSPRLQSSCYDSMS